MYSSPLKHFNKLETRNLSKTGMQSFQKADNNTVVYSPETLQSSPQPHQFPLFPYGNTNLSYERTKIMKNPVLYLLATIGVIAILFACVGATFITAVYGNQILDAVKLVWYGFHLPIEIESANTPAAASPNSAEDENDTNALDLDPTFHAFTYLPEGACVFTGGVTKPWSNGPANLNYAGIINQSTQESGFSQQAYLEHWTEEDTVAGYEYPKGKVEAGNDGGIQLEVCNINGQLYVFMLDRTGESEVPFHQASFTQLVGKRLLVCKNDTGKPGDWNGYCDEPSAYVVGIPIEDFVIPGDLTYAWSKMEDVLYDLPGNYRLPAYGEMLCFWVNQ